MARQSVHRLSLVTFSFVLILSATISNANNLTTIVDPAAEGFGKQVCVTEECSKIAAMLILNMDEKVKPCDDVTGFVCGNYKLNNDVKNDEDYQTPLQTVTNTVLTRLQVLFEAPPSPVDKPWHALAKTYYQKCIDETAIKATRKETIRTLLNEIGGWPLIEPEWQDFNTSWEEYMGMVNQKYQESFFSWVLSPNQVNVSENTLTLTPKNLNDWETDIMKYLAEFGSDVNFFPGLKAFFEGFVNDYAKVNECREGTRSGPLKLMKTKYQNFDLEVYVRRLLDGIIPVSPDLKIFIRCDNVFQKIHTVAKNKRGLANFVGLKAVLDFYRKTTTDCISDMTKIFPELVLQMYATKYFDYDGVVPKIKEMLALIKESLYEMMNNATWLDAPTRQNALKKLKEMKEIVAYRDTLFNDTIMNQKWNIPFDPSDHFYTLYARVTQKNLANILATWNKSPKFDVVSNSISMDILDQAFYSAMDNGIYVGAPFLELPFYQPNVPDYVNFAGIGHVIGYELMHGFEYYSTNVYDEKGNLRNWWTKNASDKYKTKEQCYIEQYRSHGIDNILTLGYNIADNVGAKLSYYAYKKYMARRGVETEPALPGFEKYTLDQMFFMLQANTMCDVMTKGLLEESEVYPPPHLRAKVPLKNMKEYSLAFDCSKGSPMNPDKKCSLWQ